MRGCHVQHDARDFERWSNRVSLDRSQSFRESQQIYQFTTAAASKRQMSVEAQAAVPYLHEKS